VEIEDQNLEFEEELYDLQSNFFLKVCPEKETEFLKILNLSNYTNLKNFVLLEFFLFFYVFSMFVSIFFV